MARRTISRQPMEVELFPFLSVLACTIGTLILLIVIMTTQAIGNRKEAKIVAKSEVGENQTKTPRYIECQEKGVILYPNKEVIPNWKLTEKNSPLQKLMAEVKKKDRQEYLIIVVRPDAYKVFKAVRAMAEIQKIDFGYEPLDKDWQLEIGK
jgi:biopolymer transport protein ExbD